MEKDEWECAVCGDTILPGEWFSHHQRLNVNVCSECPLTKVMGEDITTHSVLWGPRPVIGHDRLCSTQPGRHDPDDPTTIRCECSILQQARAEGRLSGAVGFGRAEYDNGFNDAVEAVLKTVDSLEGSSFWRDDVVDAISGLVSILDARDCQCPHPNPDCEHPTCPRDIPRISSRETLMSGLRANVQRGTYLCPRRAIGPHGSHHCPFCPVYDVAQSAGLLEPFGPFASGTQSLEFLRPSINEPDLIYCCRVHGVCRLVRVRCHVSTIVDNPRFCQPTLISQCAGKRDNCG